ncbi:DUF11 domain-containing protein [Methanobrevibacter sp.]|uniref:DUF11 domain-containing protein n=1 Tax=Methanobrevibacter sp. TaxID=66852 RepID=UPI0025FEEC1F|nr:DUF11 domain-containing protein [Methanobrevibacter sp.]
MFENNVWTIDEIASGDNVVLVIRTIVDASNVTIPNVVNVTSDIYDPDESNNNASNSTEIPPEADLEVTITNDHETTPCHKGDEIVWTVVVTNHGSDDAINTILDDVIPEGLIYVSDDSNGAYNNETGRWTIGYLPVDDTVTLTIVTKADASNTTITRDENVSSDVYDPNRGNNKDSSSVTVLPEADLEVTITNDHETEPCHNGDEVVWTIVVTNHGPDGAINTVLKDILPDGLIYVSDDSQGTYDNESAVWTIGDLPVGDTVTLTIKTKVNTSNATITKDVSVSSDTYDPNLSNNKDKSSVDVIPEADLEVIKLVSDNAPYKGDTITWTIIVVNNGRDTAVNTVVKDKLPSGLVYVSDDSNGAYNHATGIWTVGDLANGESATLSIKTLVSVTNKTIINVADAVSDTYDPNKENNKGDNSTNAHSEVDLEVNVVPKVETVNVGDEAIFEVTVINHGPDTAENTRVFVTIPDELKPLGFKPSKGTYDPDTGRWDVGDLAPGEVATLLIDTVALKSGNFMITARAECDGNETDYSKNSDGKGIDVIVSEPDVKHPNKDVPRVHATMHATGNPIVMVLLALLAIVGTTLRRKF